MLTMAHVSKAKKKTVETFVRLIKEYPIVGAVNVENLPAKQLQKMRETLRGKVIIFMGKRRLMTIALEATKGEKNKIEDLIPHLKGMPALLFTKENPFSLFKTLKKNKSNAPIKGGQKAPNDIIVPAGPTTFAPGPIIGQLGGIGIAAGIENGKVAIKKDSLVAKEDEIVSAEKASILTRLGIEPMEIGLDLVAAYDAGVIFNKKILNIDEEEYLNNISTAHRWAFNLAMDSGILTPETINSMITKAFCDALALATSENIFTDETTTSIISKAHNQMLSLASGLPDEAKSDELKSVKAPVQTTAPATEKKEEKIPDKKEEKKPEEAAAGLGSLFG